MPAGVVLAGVVISCPVPVEDDDVDGVMEEEEEAMVEEDDALMVTLKYCDLNRGPPLPFKASYIPSQKRLVRDRFCVGLLSQE